MDACRKRPHEAQRCLSTRRLASAAAQASGKAEARFQALKHLPGCLVVVCKAYYESADRVEKEEQRALLAVHNLALGLSAQGVGVTESTTTQLEATSTVTTLGDVDDNMLVTSALSETSLTLSLAQKLPTVGFEIKQFIITPPAASPTPPSFKISCR